MLVLLIDEFNCNHQADVTSEESVLIYERSSERKFIKNFLQSNINSKKAGLIYLCGHPGTGKTSTLNLCLHEMIHDIPSVLNPIETFMHNAMSYSNVK